MIMATYAELELIIEELKARTGRMSISPAETFDLIEKVLEKTKGVDFSAASMSVRRSYATKTQMEADNTPTDAETGKPLKYGQAVAVTNDPVSANNGVYRYLNPGWELVFRYNDSLLWLKENVSSLKISRLYDSIVAMEADNAPSNADTELPLKIGELAAISNPDNQADPDNGKVYAWTGDDWLYMGTLNNITSMQFTNNFFDTI